MNLQGPKTLLVGPAQLEASKGFDNRSVFAGFDKFASSKLFELSKIEPRLKAKSLELSAKFKDYQTLGLSERQKLVTELLALVSTAPKNLTPKPYRQVTLSPSSPVSTVSSVGPSRADLLGKMGIKTVLDLLNHFPNRYIDRSKLAKIKDLKTGDEVTIAAMVSEVRPPKPNRNLVQACFSDETGHAMATWFNNPYIIKKLVPGQVVMVSGKVGDFGGPHFTNPDIIPQMTGEGQIIPVYPATAGLSQWLIRLAVKGVLEHMPAIGEGFAPVNIVQELSMPSLGWAYRHIHKPEKITDTKKAQDRLVFDEFLLLETSLLLRRAQYKREDGPKIEKALDNSDAFYKTLPFAPTNAQERCRKEIAKDLSSGSPMNRLLHGDVGSGKTAVGLSACFAILQADLQVAWLAPTEVLASQTFRVASRLLGDNILYLSGATTKAQRAAVFDRLSSGESLMLVGTHALLENWVSFQKLGLVVVDEQHRFGVLQRAKLAEKGLSPHILVMSATPIPRTLAMTLYGDLDVSVVDEMPKGREPIATKVLVNSSQRAYDLAKSEIAQGRQVYVVCPLVKESEKLEVKAAVSLFTELSEGHFAGIKCSLLHGRMLPKEKDEVMRGFSNGEAKVLISTTVIEVGVDVPNATVMIIENAERFGLAQLHQLRGRVGRGVHKSYCFLLPSRPSQALQILEHTNNGLEVAEEDLRLRGPGDFGGTEQSGLPNLNAARLLSPSNFSLLSLAKETAESILKTDPDLASPTNTQLKEGIIKYMAEKVGLAWVS